MTTKIAFILVALISSSAFSLELSKDQLLQAAVSLSVFDQKFSSLDEITTNVSANGFDYRSDIAAAESQLVDSGFELIPSQEWMKTRGQELLSQPNLIRSASIQDVRMLLGGLGRQERFISGLIGKAILDGVYAQAHARISQAALR